MNRRLSGPTPRLGRLAIALQAIAALAFVVVLLAAEGVRMPFTATGDWTISAAFADAGGIHGGERTPVLVAGVPIGTVTGVTVDQGVAVVTMRLGGSTRGVVRSDATAAIEPRSALEDMTVDITPGSADAPPARPGMRIAAARTQPTTTLDRVTAVLDADTRGQLEIVLDQLAAGLRGGGRDRLRAAIEQLHSLLDPATQVAGALARRRGLLSDLVDSLSQIGTAAERGDLSLANALNAGAQTLAVTARRQDAVAATVGSLPATMTSLNGALQSVRALATPLVPTVAGLTPTATALPSALSAVRALAPSAGELLSTADAFARTGAAPLRTAASALGELGGVASALTPAISRLEPIVAAVNAHRQGIGQLGERFSGVLSTDDANGPILRGLGTFEPFNPADFGYPSATGAQKATLAAQAVRALTLTCLHGQPVACLVRYLVPGLPGSVR
jgi:phospholipid/cholesterol/gamma-HCH transport system substrate-binding protein